jgi:DNA-binding NtrC family response regulator
LKKNKVALVIDDDEGIRRAVTRALRDDFVQIVTVPNGQVAEGFLCDGIDLIITDVTMPIMPGHQFHQKHATYIAEHRIGVLAMSGGTTLRGALEYFASVGVTVIDKPFSKEALLAAARTHTRQ